MSRIRRSQCLIPQRRKPLAGPGSTTIDRANRPCPGREPTISTEPSHVARRRPTTTSKQLRTTGFLLCPRWAFQNGRRKLALSRSEESRRPTPEQRRRPARHRNHHGREGVVKSGAKLPRSLESPAQHLNKWPANCNQKLHHSGLLNCAGESVYVVSAVTMKVWESWVVWGLSRPLPAGRRSHNAATIGRPRRRVVSRRSGSGRPRNDSSPGH